MFVEDPPMMCVEWGPGRVGLGCLGGRIKCPKHVPKWTGCFISVAHHIIY